MKRILCSMLLAGVAVAATWYEVKVPLEGEEFPEVLAGFDVVGAKPGFWAEIIATDQDLEKLDQAGIGYEIVIADLATYYASRMLGPTPFGDYYTYDEANAILDSLYEAYPGIISQRMILPNDSLGDTTWNGNYVWAVKVSDNVEQDENEPEVLYTGIHHAREPIGANICVEWARWLCENYGKDPLVTYLVDNREIWIIPVINPDGYLYNEKIAPGGGGMHRKNRRQTGAEPQGVDNNRNYPYMWGYDDQGSSPDPGEETYRGPNPGSEPETQSVMNFCKAHSFVTALNFHSAANLFLYPWGYIQQKCEDSLAFYGWGEIGTRTAHYAVIGGHELYITNGDSDDWMYGKHNIFAVTPEVGEQFWQEWQIDQHIEETRPLLIATAKAADIYPELLAVYWSDGGDGEISPGETVDLVASVHNMSVKNESGQIELELSTNDSRAELIAPSASISSLAPQTGGTNQADPLQVRVSASAPPDSAIPLTLTVEVAGEEFIHRIFLPVGSRQTLIAEDFETFDSLSWYNDWEITDEDAHSGNLCITDSPQENYRDERTYYLEIISPLDLSDKVTGEVSFWHRFAIEKGWDWAAFEVRTENTDDWVTLKRFSGTANEWQETRFDISEFCGAEEFKLRFTLTTDQAVTEDGWYLDDIVLTAFKGVPSGLHELADIRPRIGPVETVSSGNLNFFGPAGTSVEVAVFDAAGREVAETEGTTPFSWQMQDVTGRALPAGVYFVKTSTRDQETTCKVVVVN